MSLRPADVEEVVVVAALEELAALGQPLAGGNAVGDSLQDHFAVIDEAGEIVF